MQLLIGFFFFSVLLTTGSALWCENCISESSDCSGSKQKCNFDNPVCLKLTSEVAVGPLKAQATMKRCSPKNACKILEDLKGKTTTQIPGLPPGESVFIKEVTCSKAPPSFASFFPAFLGLLLMKLLF